MYLSCYFTLFVCGISLTPGQLINELFPDCTRSCFSQVVLRCRGGDRIYEKRYLFVAVGPNARFIVLPHWDNISYAHMLTHPVTLYRHWADQLCFVVPISSTRFLCYYDVSGRRRRPRFQWGANRTS